MIRLRPLLALLLLAVFASAEERHVVMISVDALRPEFYLDPASVGAKAPNLVALRDEGACVEAVESVFPSVTYPNHASLVTGVRPARHGILANTVFLAPKSPTWYVSASMFKCPTLWDRAKGAGLTVASVHWPTSEGAKIDFLVPEPDYRPRDQDAMWKETLEGSRPEGFLLKVAARSGMVDPKEMDEPKLDQLITTAACVAIEEGKPGLVLVHLLEVDGAQHEHGRDGAEVAAALEAVDGCIGRIRESIAKAGIAATTTIVLCGDHGFMTVRGGFRPNAALKKAGLAGDLRGGKGWKVRAHTSGNQAEIYVEDPKDQALVDAAWKAIDEASTRDGKKLVRMLSRKELDEMGTCPGAAFAIAGEDGVSVEGDASEPAWKEYGAPKGNHGSLPTFPQLHTGLILAGRGVKKGARLQAARVIDVAPTAARLLGIEMPDVEGHALDELLEK